MGGARGSEGGEGVSHVDVPQDVVRATWVAMDYWLQFQNDVVIDMTCFRRW